MYTPSLLVLIGICLSMILFPNGIIEDKRPRTSNFHSVCCLLTTLLYGPHQRKRNFSQWCNLEMLGRSIALIYSRQMS